MSQCISEKEVKVDEIPLLKDHVPRVDRKMDNATKPSGAKRKHSVPRVATQSRPRKSPPKRIKAEPITTLTRSKKATKVILQ